MHRKKVILFIRKTNIIGGIETFIYNFCYFMSLYFDITVVCEVMADIQADRLKPFAEVKRGEASKLSYKLFNWDTRIKNKDIK